MMARMDYNFGKILDTLDRLKITENTIVIFVSDNCGAYEADIGNLKGGKTDLHEGGIRVAGLARWPGRIQPGSESDVLSHSNDLLPTLCHVAEVPMKEEISLDGMSLAPLFTDALSKAAKWPERILINHWKSKVKKQCLLNMHCFYAHQNVCTRRKK